MSKALILAKKVFSSKQQRFETESSKLSPQESSLFRNAMIFLESPDLSFLTWDKLEEIANKLDRGGVLDPPYILRMNHQFSAQDCPKKESTSQINVLTPGVDDISASNVCRRSISSMTECFILELIATSKGIPAEGRYLTVKSIEPCFKISAVQLCVEDKHGTLISLGLYNFISMDVKLKDVQEYFPINTVFYILNPYLKCSNYGNLALRVDNPFLVIIERPNASKPNIDRITVAVEELKAKGNALFASNDHIHAIACYKEAITANEQLFKDLLSNRAASHLALHDYKAALADCEVVEKLEPAHIKTKSRKQKALEGLRNPTTSTSTSTDNLPQSPQSFSAINECDSSTIESLKAQGNVHFRNGNHAASIDFYTRGISASESMAKTLHSNRAASHLLLCDYTAAIDDCAVVLSLDPSHAKALDRKHKALLGQRIAQQQRQGIYDYLNLPFNPIHQNRVENYFGPIEIRSAKHKGRGLFVTRDVHVGELLFVEKAFAYRENDKNEILHATNFAKKVVATGSQFHLTTDMIILANKDSKANTQLSYLMHDTHTPNSVIPNMNNFRSNTFEEVPIVSAKEVAGICALNSYSYTFIGEPTMEERKHMAITLAAGVDANVFVSGSRYRMALAAERCPQLKQQKQVTSGGAELGTAMWIVGSFMNHDTKKPSVNKEHFGKLMVVSAQVPLKAGEELTVSYHTDPVMLKKQWGIQ